MKNLQLFHRLVEKSIKEKTIDKRTEDSLNWYRKKVSAFWGDKNYVNPASVFGRKAKDKFSGIMPGMFYAFKYDPVGKTTLPYYDKFPLILCLKKVERGFLGLNFHYLSPKDRAYFMDKLYRYRHFDEDLGEVINISYEELKKKFSLRHYKACIKRYRFGHIKNMFMQIHGYEWKVALFLPSDVFNAPRSVVWKDSKEISK
jgi:hypothetical protein